MIDGADWSRLYVEHMHGKTIKQIAEEQSLTDKHVSEQLSKMKRRSREEIERAVRQAFWRQLGLIAAAFECGANEEAGRIAARMLQGIRAAQAMGMNMNDKPKPEPRDKRRVADLSGPRLELLERLDRLTPERGEKSLGDADERGASRHIPRGF